MQSCDTGDMIHEDWVQEVLDRRKAVQALLAQDARMRGLKRIYGLSAHLKSLMDPKLVQEAEIIFGGR